MSSRLYADWKHAAVVEAFRQQGLAPEIAPLVAVPPGTRRRAVLSAVRVGRAIVLGFHERRTNTVVPLAECPVLVPAIVAALPALAETAGIVMTRDEARLTVIASPAGLDVALVAGGRAPGPGVLARLAALATAHRFARISLDGETVIERARPALVIAGVATVPPPAAFVQATAAAEAVIAAHVVAGIGKARRVADLFAGIGTFSLAVAERARVLAVDSEAAALVALATAARGAERLKPIETLVRDLVREPLSVLELQPFDAVVLDPPRAGAKAQIEMLAKAKVGRIVYVSCNPATFARDAAILVNAGFALGSVTPIDQFLWSEHIESTAVFTRP